MSTANVVVAPSLLAADFLRLSEQLSELRTATSHLHFDAMDGLFVPNISFGLPLLEAVKKGSFDLFIDAHLMIDRPERFVSDFAAAGADGITVHLEATAHVHRVLGQIREAGLAAGVAINPGTPVSLLRSLAEEDLLDLLLIMSVNPGFGGQRFIARSVARVAEAAAMLAEAGSAAIVQVDGGVSAANAAELVAAGARNLVAGSAVFAHEGGPAAGVRAIEAALSGPPATPPRQ